MHLAISFGFGASVIEFGEKISSCFRVSSEKGEHIRVGTDLTNLVRCVLNCVFYYFSICWLLAL